MKKIMILLNAILVLSSVSAFAGEIQSFKFQRNFAGDQTYAIAQGYVNRYDLTASTAKTVTIPTGARYAKFSGEINVWVLVGTGTATVPAGDITDGTASFLNPSVYFIEGQTQMSIISESAGSVSIEFCN